MTIQEELVVGSKLRAKWTEKFADNVTKAKIYEVVEVTETGFFIINDNGRITFPISTTFTRVE